MKKSSSQFFVCKQGCFSLDPNFKCAHEGGKSQGSDDIVLILDDEPGNPGHSPGEKIAAARERDRERYEKRAQSIAKRREVIEEILRNLRAGLVKSKQWTNLMHIGRDLPQLPVDFHWWPARLALTVRDLVWELDERSWSDSK